MENDSLRRTSTQEMCRKMYVYIICSHIYIYIYITNNDNKHNNDDNNNNNLCPAKEKKTPAARHIIYVANRARESPGSRDSLHFPSRKQQIRWPDHQGNSHVRESVYDVAVGTMAPPLPPPPPPPLPVSVQSGVCPVRQSRGLRDKQLCLTKRNETINIKKL